MKSITKFNNVFDFFTIWIFTSFVRDSYATFRMADPISSEHIGTVFEYLSLVDLCYIEPKDMEESLS